MKGFQSVGQFVIFALVFAFFVAVIHPFIISVILGLLISLVFRPIYFWLNARLKNRTHLAAAISTFMVIICVLLPLILIAVFVIQDVSKLTATMSHITKNVGSVTDEVFKIPALSNLFDAVNKIHPVSRDAFAKGVESALAKATASGQSVLASAAASVVRKLVALVFFLIAFYFGLVDGSNLAGFLKDNSPFPHRDTNQLFAITEKICNAVVLGALLAGTVQGIIVGTAYWALGIPQPLLFGVLTAVFSFVPLVGCAPTCIGGIVYLLAMGSPVRALLMCFVFLIAGVSDNVVKPWVLKGRTELHPLLGLLSVLGGLRLFGFAGLFLGPVITALAVVLVQLLHRRVTSLSTPETPTVRSA